MSRQITISNLEKNEKQLAAILKLSSGKTTLVAQNGLKQPAAGTCYNDKGCLDIFYPE